MIVVCGMQHWPIPTGIAFETGLRVRHFAELGDSIPVARGGSLREDFVERVAMPVAEPADSVSQLREVSSPPLSGVACPAPNFELYWG